MHKPVHVGEVRYTLQAQGPGGAATQEIVIQVGEVQPTPEPPTATPTATPEPPTATPEPPTATPEPPTATPEPPTATPEPPTATPVPPGQDIMNKNWILESMTEAKSAPQPVLEGSKVNIFFDPSGAFNGNAGCNDYAGSYVVGDDNALTLTLGQVTNMICNDPPGVMEQEQQYIQLLANVTSYLVDEGDHLNLYTSDNWTLSYRMGPAPK